MSEIPAPSRRYAHGLVLGKFYPLHAGHGALIRRALVDCERVTVEVLGSVVESIPLDVRAAWLREEHPTARVVSAWDEAEVDYDSPEVWDEHMRVIEGLLDGPVDAVFTSDGYGEELARRLDADWVRVDPDRVTTPVSGRAIRADVEGHWHLLPPSVRSWFVQRIVVLGAESTGTTTLAELLAARAPDRVDPGVRPRAHDHPRGRARRAAGGTTSSTSSRTVRSTRSVPRRARHLDPS